MSHLFPVRADLIGKRILTFGCATNDANDARSRAPARARRGVIRASTARNSQNSNTKVLVEFEDDEDWGCQQCRQWVEICTEDNVYLEDKLVWANKYVGPSCSLKLALAYRALAMMLDMVPDTFTFVEFLCDKSLIYQNSSSFQPFRVEDIPGLSEDDRRLVTPWIDCHLSQLLLLGFPSLAVGRQIQVYNSVDDDSLWRSARVLAADDHTKLITLLDESKSEERTEDPALIQIWGLPMTTDGELWNAALKLVKKRPNEDLFSHIDIKRVRKMGTEDQGTLSGQSEHLSTRSFTDALSSTVPQPYESIPVTVVECLLSQDSQHVQSEHSSTRSFTDDLLSTVLQPYESLSESVVQCLLSEDSQHVPDTPPSASLSKSVENSVFVNSTPSASRTDEAQSPALNGAPVSTHPPHCSDTHATNAFVSTHPPQCSDTPATDALVSTHPPQCSESIATPATNASSSDDIKKVSSLFRYRVQSPATFQNRPTSGFGHNSPAGPRYPSPRVFPLSGTNLPMQKTGPGIPLGGYRPKTPQNGLCSSVRTKIDELSSLWKVAETRKAPCEREEEGQLQIPVVIHSDRKWSSPGMNRGARHASGGKGENVFHSATSPVKSQNLIVVDLVDDNNTTKSGGFERGVASNGSVKSGQASRPRVSHEWSAQPNRRAPQIKLQQGERNAWIKEMERFIGKKLEEGPKGIQQASGGSRGQTLTEVVNKSRLETNIAQPRSTIIDSTSGNRFVGKQIEERSKGNQKIGGGSGDQTSDGVVKKSEPKIIVFQHRSPLGSSTASDQPARTVKTLKQKTSVQRPSPLPVKPPTKEHSSESTIEFHSPKSEKLSTLKKLKSTTRALSSIRTVSGRVPQMGASGTEEDKVLQNVVRGYDEESQGLVGVMKLLKILDEEFVWPLSGDVTKTAKEKKKPMEKDLVNSGNSDSVRDRHLGFVSPRSKSKLRSPDCKIKIRQFKKSISDQNGIEYESPSLVLSRKLLNGTEALLPQNSFVQEDSCVDLASPLTICRECKSGPKGLDKNTKILCRFFAFRRLNTTNKGTCKATGFCSPRDADGADVSLWMPLVPITAPQIDIDMAKYIVKNVGNRFCELVEQEKEAMTWSPVYSVVVWKRPVHGVREMCDVCNTTLFNVHWVCGKCGFVVCLDCFRTMTQKCAMCTDEVGCKICDRGRNRWPRCTYYTRPFHEPSQLMLTQIIPSDVLWTVGRMIHSVRKKWKMFTNCPCGEDRKGLLTAGDAVQESCSAACTETVSLDGKDRGTAVTSSPAISKTISKKTVKRENHKLLMSSSGRKEQNKKVFDVPSMNVDSKPFTSSSGRKIIHKKDFDAALTNGDVRPLTSSSGDKKKMHKKVSDVPSKNGDSEPITSPSVKKEVNEKSFDVPPKNGDITPEVDKKCFNLLQTTDVASLKSPTTGSEKPDTSSSTLSDMIMKNISLADVKRERKMSDQNSQTLDDILKRVAGDRRLHVPALTTRSLHAKDLSKPTSAMRRANPITRNSLSTTQLQYPDVAHAWLDNGRLLQLLEPRHQSNIHLFQQQWKHGQPVLISKCDQYLNQDLWLPESFANEFGDEENDLVDCSRKVVLVGHKMRRFWDGFERVTARLKDKHGLPMILKLKDWPPTEDFSELLPSRFEDLLRSLPMPEYTQRTGVFNLVSRLPEFFVRPDLGPKMYNAYGSALYPRVGSTNLHLDVSDAVNLILYVGIPKDDKEDHELAAVEAMKEAGCCELTMGRILKGGEKPGALWHIFDPQDSDKIRDLLHKVASEVGEPIGPHHDPIHDQSWYLDERLRKRLFAEYAVECYTLVQCVGDAIFIPAGAPHQVRNLHSCIKAAEDFVSPENLSYCFKLTQEFRHLSDKHSNHEDKLQVKNIIYHAVKDAIAVLMHHDP